MTRLSEITAHIENVRQLQSVVTAMRGIAASRAQQSRTLLAAIESYASVVARGIGETLRLAPADWSLAAPLPASGKRALILFFAEGGFCGGLSDRVLDAALADLDGSLIYAVGTRGIAIADERGIRPDWTAAMANQIGTVPAVAERVAGALYAGVAAGDFERAEVIYPRPEGGGTAVVRLSLLPLDVSRFLPKEKRQPPLIELPWEQLVEDMAAEYVYALLCSAAMHAFEAENQARMVAMAAARTHIADTLEDLSMREHEARQEDITSEIVELSVAALLRQP